MQITDIDIDINKDVCIDIDIIIDRYINIEIEIGACVMVEMFSIK